MCGYAGVALGVNTTELIEDRMLIAMGETIRLRGPDAQGVWSDRALGVGLVHQRLAIQDLSPLGAQPMVSPSGRYTIAFNGEIYNFKTIKQSLIEKGFKFKGGS